MANENKTGKCCVSCKCFYPLHLVGSEGKAFLTITVAKDGRIEFLVDEKSTSDPEKVFDALVQYANDASKEFIEEN